MNINFVFEASVNSAPAGFITALEAAAAYLDSLITNPITVNIQIGFGDLNGSPLAAGDAGEFSDVGLHPFLSYSQVVSELTSHATSAADLQSLEGLPTVDPTEGGTFFIAPAQLKAWGLAPANGTEVDGYIGFSSTFDYDTDRSDGISPGEADLIGTAEHEISHVLGRATGLQAFEVNNFTPLDLFRYSGLGLHQLVAGQPAYFSIDNGTINLENFDPAAKDGDWLSSGPPDANNAGGPLGVEYDFSATDATEMDVLGFTVATSGVNIFHAGVAPNSFVGNGDHNQILFDGPIAEYSLVMNGAGVTITDNGSSGDGTAQVSGIEYLRFTDQTVFVENADNANIARLYSAAFDRAPDIAGLSFWEDIYTNNISAAVKSSGYYIALAQTNDGSGVTIADGFIQSSEFQHL